MKICRFGNNRVGVVIDDHVRDVTDVVQATLNNHPTLGFSDPLIAQLTDLRPLIDANLETSEKHWLADVDLRSPVERPPKLVAAPVNYRKHVEESQRDAGIHYGSAVKDIETAGLFLKSPTSLVGPSEGVKIRFPDRRNDHEVELAVIIGRQADRITRERALDYVAGYCIGLDMTVRGPEDRSFRKSANSYSVLGPWLVTADEFGPPTEVALSIKVNGEVRQDANTRDLIIDVAGLIEFASKWYTLYPGDVLYTGTPEGVGPVVPGDVMEATIAGIGSMKVRVA